MDITDEQNKTQGLLGRLLNVGPRAPARTDYLVVLLVHELISVDPHCSVFYPGS